MDLRQRLGQRTRNLPSAALRTALVHAQRLAKQCHPAGLVGTFGLCLGLVMTGIRWIPLAGKFLVATNARRLESCRFFLLSLLLLDSSWVITHPLESRDFDSLPPMNGRKPVGLGGQDRYGSSDAD